MTIHKLSFIDNNHSLEKVVLKLDFMPELRYFCGYFQVPGLEGK